MKDRARTPVGQKRRPKYHELGLMKLLLTRRSGGSFGSVATHGGGIETSDVVRGCWLLIPAAGSIMAVVFAPTKESLQTERPGGADGKFKTPKTIAKPAGVCAMRG